MKYLINYADDNYRDAQMYCTKMAKLHGGFDQVIEYSPKDIPEMIVNMCPEGIFSNDRKAKRYGLWRPFIIKHTLEMLDEGDYLCYCDSGAYFIRNIDLIIKDMELKEQEIRVFSLPLLERQWTKRDVFIYFDADVPEITDSQQILTTYFFIKKSNPSVKFFDEYYRVSVDMPSLFTDEPNILGQTNYVQFIENRHNQSVFSVLCKINRIKPEIDISEYGLHPKLYSYSSDVIYMPCKSLGTMPFIISHRRNKVDFWVHCGNFLRIFLPSGLFYAVLRITLFIHKIYKGMIWKKKKG